MARVFILIKRQLRTFNCKCSASKKDLKKKNRKEKLLPLLCHVSNQNMDTCGNSGQFKP